MSNAVSKIFSGRNLQLVLFLIINTFFILKYTPRYNFNPYTISIGFWGFVFAFIYVYDKFSIKISERKFKILYLLTVLSAIAIIVLLFYKIEPYTIRVDRWSALTYFWDSVFNGQYPYTTHTHVSTTNFASPFPVWHLISLPFYLLGDVGYEIIFFLILTTIFIRYYFQSYKISFYFISLLLMSPGYWWEVSARSDSLSNGLLVFMIILYFIKNGRTLSNSFLLIIIACGLIAGTRFTAIVPLALFFFQSYFKLPVKNKIIFPLGILSIAFIAFSPFVFWDTETWVFFKRNPFMSQTANGNLYVFILMLVIGIFAGLSWKKNNQFFNVTSIFLFIFLLTSQLVRIYNAGEGNLFSDGISDISYFNLSLPYCIVLLSSTLSEKCTNT